ncbi:hypothetical protein [Methylobacterium sp. R2-1]|uniref:hypothetical protein n=1 Tax=Methylobacterium sp. R2-1 TaxID=2587064 RepID=UPI00160F619A|nr:hypothetical protein [Methylobacterium sp. R2-1]MBB2964751.1 putative RNA-binding Zn-ribbon protein involved in translation (DUF1610 family) [Methylobacterium sp. R2-1]
MDVMAGIAAASQALKMAREIREVSKDFENADLKSKIVALVETLSDAKLALIDAKEELQNAKSEAEELRTKLAFKTDRTVRRNGMYYEIYDDGQPSYLPFCPRCTETGKFITIVQEQNAHQAKCPNCSTQFATRAIRFKDNQSASNPSRPAD